MKHASHGRSWSRNCSISRVKLPQLRKRRPRSWLRGYQSPPTSSNRKGTKGSSILILACRSQLQQQGMNGRRWYQQTKGRRKCWKSYGFFGWRYQSLSYKAKTYPTCRPFRIQLVHSKITLRKVSSISTCNWHNCIITRIWQPFWNHETKLCSAYKRSTWSLSIGFLFGCDSNCCFICMASNEELQKTLQTLSTNIKSIQDKLMMLKARAIQNGADLQQSGSGMQFSSTDLAGLTLLWYMTVVIMTSVVQCIN